MRSATVKAPLLPRLERSSLVRGLRFGCVGLSGVAVDTAVLWALTAYLHMHYLLAALFAAECAILTNFLLHDTWTFAGRRRGGRLLPRLASFHAVAAGSLLISVGGLPVVRSLLPVHLLVANLFALGAATLWNFSMSTAWVWRAARPAPALVIGEAVHE